jgi:hypothetical protein
LRECVKPGSCGATLSGWRACPDWDRTQSLIPTS